MSEFFNPILRGQANCMKLSLKYIWYKLISEYASQNKALHRSTSRLLNSSPTQTNNNTYELNTAN